MASLKEIQRRLKKVGKQKLKSRVVEIVVNDEEIIFYKINDFKQGVRPDGSLIGRYRSKNYELFKASLNPIAGGAVDLILTGSFVNKLYVHSLGMSRFIFKSRDKKSGLLQERWGQDIMGLNQKDFDKLQKEKYAPMLIQYIKQITGL